VRELQRKLGRLDYGAGPVDGLFGPLTADAVRRFQADSGLAVDGIAGSETVRRLRLRARRLERLVVPGTGFRAGGSERVRELQRALNRLDYRAGNVDGLFGPVTERAVRRFQRENALAIDGVAGPRTLRVLNGGSQPAGGSAPPEVRTPGRAPARQVLPTEEPDAISWVLFPILGALLGLCVAVVLALRGPRETRRDRATAAGNGLQAVRETKPNREHSVIWSRPPGGPWRVELVDVPYARRLLGVGAQADVAHMPLLEAHDAVLQVSLKLFAEGQHSRWETELLDGGAPFLVSLHDLEESVRRIVVPDRLPILARVLRSLDINLEPSELELLPFMLELTPELEHDVAERSIGTSVM
jgi:peptidoglycan hydrolase-like protein with peptidoglycan-binding domain